MRTFVPFALALIGPVAFTADASAFGKRNGGGSGCYGGCYGGGYVSSGGTGYVIGGYGSVGYGGPAWSGAPVGYPGNFGASFGAPGTAIVQPVYVPAVAYAPGYPAHPAP